MGLRLHYATEYKVEWDGGDFNYAVEEIANWLEDNVPFEQDGCWFWQDEYSEDSWEISKPAVKATINKLRKKLAKTEPEKITEDIDEKDILEFLENAYKKAEKSLDYIKLVWF